MIRASDDNREHTVDTLREHAGAGRLTVDELEERTAAALQARTLDDLTALTADLPVVRAAPSPPRRGRQTELRAFVAVSVLMLVIWAATGAGYFWPVWPIAGWGMSFLMPGPSRRTGCHSVWSRH